mgnify:CR=1 FL=1
MKLQKLQLENFRSYDDFCYEFPQDQDVTILVGENGRGKTNFLEAVYLLSLGRSFRTLKKEDLVNWDKDYLRCKCETSSDEEEQELEVFYAKAPIIKKNYKRNEVNLKNSEFLGSLLTVLFHPEDLNMLYLSPSFRRKYMDILLSQTDKKYLAAISNYRKVMKQRNALLHSIRNNMFKGLPTDALKHDLDAWDSQLSALSIDIIQKRQALVEYLAEHLEEIYKSISGQQERIDIKYKRTPPEKFEEDLAYRRGKDIRDAKTTIGPHLDDLEFFIDGKEITSSASRGEFRTLLLAIKLAEIHFIRERTGQNPVLLLDDVFSELDKERQKSLIKAIEGCQTIITSTDKVNSEELAKERGNIGFVKIK